MNDPQIMVQQIKDSNTFPCKVQRTRLKIRERLAKKIKVRNIIGLNHKKKTYFLTQKYKEVRSDSRFCHSAIKLLTLRDDQSHL